MNIYEKLSNIQQELKAPKNQYNSFGGYKYRSCEDILEAVKPLLKKNKCTLTIEDRLEQIGDRYYIKSVARLTDTEKPFIEDDEIGVVNEIINVAYAREEESKKGMDGSQITGASSSYARKYALNGLFLIDDVKDSDATNISYNEEKEEKGISDKQLGYINKLIQGGKIDQEEMLRYYNINDVEELTLTQASEIIKMKGGN